MNFERICFLIFTVLSLFGLYFSSLYSYLLFHSLVEMYTIAVASGIFFVTWNTRDLIKDGYLLFLGIAYLFLGIVELLHTLAYKGMMIFTGYDANLPTQLWILEGYMESISFFTAAYFIRRKAYPFPVFLVFLIITAFFLILIFTNNFPDCFIEGFGLTLFKKTSEIIISLIFLTSVILLQKNRQYFDPNILNMLFLAVFFNIGARLAFIFYINVYGFSNMIGHYFQLISFYWIYRAVVETGLKKPNILIFRELARQKDALQEAHNRLEQGIAERTAELVQAIEKLKTEIADRKKMEDALRESEERFRNTFEFANVGIAHVGLDGRWLRVNKEVCRITGYSKDELLMMTFQDITHPDDLEKDLENVSALLEGKTERYSMEKRYIQKNKDIVWVLLTVSSARDSVGNPKHFISVIQDINERKSVDELLEIYNKELEQSNRELEDFAHIVSHDLREPLRGIYNFSKILLENYQEKFDNDGQYMLEQLLLLTLRLDGHIAAILEYSRIGRTKLSVKETDLNAVVADVLHSLEFMIKENNAEIIIPEILPVILCDKIRIREVFLNLITNAIKYNDKKEKKVEIGWIRKDYGVSDSQSSILNPQSSIPNSQFQIPNSSIIFYVRDNGIGIKSEHIDNIFKMFKRLHSQEKYGGGTGAGLAIVKKIVERHGGKIWVESAPEKGSVFYFTLNE